MASQRLPWLDKSYGNLPLSFEANQGQFEPRVKFVSRNKGYALLLTPDEAVLSLPTAAVARAKHPRRVRQEAPKKPCAWRDARIRKSSAPKETPTLRMRLVGASPSPKIVGLDELPGKVNYFLGSDPITWRKNIPTYSRIKYDSVYPGVDVIYYGNQHELENDFVVAPGADPGLITVALQGASSLTLDINGDVTAHIAGEEIRLRKPTIYQGEGTSRRLVNGRYDIPEEAFLTVSELTTRCDYHHVFPRGVSIKASKVRAIRATLLLTASATL